MAGGLANAWVPMAANRCMLPVFLIANVMTGAVNMSIDTLAVGDWSSRGIVACYMGAMCAAAVVCDQLGLTFRFSRQ